MIKQFVKDSISKVLEKLGLDQPVLFDVDSPPKPKMGDFATNVAMVLSHEKKQNPKELAEKIVAELNNIEKIDATIAGPGFINIRLDNSLYIDEIKNILSQKENYGKQEIGKGRKVSIDYVSPNPTGPVHIGNARGGPIGEAFANLFEWMGFDVSRDLYLNDTGVQTIKLGESLYYYLEKSLGNDPEFPENGYRGEYIKDLFGVIQKKHKDKLHEMKDKTEIIEFFRVTGLGVLVEQNKYEIGLLGINFKNWYSQTTIQKEGKTEEIISKLEESGHVEKSEGATWFKSPNDPDLKDRESVLKKSDGETYTYFADDIAFHMKRFDQGYDMILDLWGANHHGHVPRMKAALKALGIDEDRNKIILYQFVRVKDGGKLITMSKRTGDFITLQDVLEMGVKPDAFKYFILSQNLNTPLDFDIKLAKDTSEKNPVFYIQYAHARICSILKKSEDRGETEIDFKLLTDPRELALIRELTKFPELLTEINDSFQIQAFPHFAHKIATLFHDFYANCQVLSDDKELSSARLALASSCKFVLKNVLAVCDITAPEAM